MASELAALAWSTGAQGGTLMATAVPETDKAMAVDIREPAEPQAMRRPDAAAPWQGGMGAHTAQPAGGRRPRQPQPQQRRQKKKKKGQKRAAVPHAAVGGASAPPPAKAKRFSFK
eukprot:COSAG01_NODE_16290_length_1250_cov_1.406603_2_plen_115_part_00